MFLIRNDVKVPDWDDVPPGLGGSIRGLVPAKLRAGLVSPLPATLKSLQKRDFKKKLQEHKISLIYKTILEGIEIVIGTYSFVL